MWDAVVPAGCRLRAAPGTAFLSLDGRNAVFCEAAQRIYALNDTAAFIWCQIGEGLSPSAAADALAGTGLGRDRAVHYVRQALTAWLRLGLVRIEEVPARAPGPHAFGARLGPLAVSVGAPDVGLAQALTALVAAPGPAAANDDVYRVVRAGDLVHALHAGTSVVSRLEDEFVPALKAHLTERILARSTPDVVLHAACLVRGGRSLLLSGPPGAGKTTLTLHLAAAGFDYAGDDITLFDPAGTVRGIGFAPTVKAGAWEMVARVEPQLHAAPVHRRPDGQRVRYVRPARVAADRSHPVGWIVFLDRGGAAPARLAPLGRVDALRRVIGASYSSGGRLTLPVCGALKRGVAGADCFTLHYADAAQAAACLAAFCDG